MNLINHEPCTQEDVDRWFASYCNRKNITVTVGPARNTDDFGYVYLTYVLGGIKKEGDPLTGWRSVFADERTTILAVLEKEFDKIVSGCNHITLRTPLQFRTRTITDEQAGDEWQWNFRVRLTCRYAEKKES